MNFDPSKELPVMEYFYSLQGEGKYQGYASFFIRLAGCDVGCHWCDVKESWESSIDQLTPIAELIQKVKESGTQIVIITGGEPLMHNLDFLTDALHQLGIRVHVETSGTSPITGKWSWICFSPKKFKEALPEYYEKANELKVIIFNKSDFAWAQTHAEKVNADCQLFLQPEWSVKYQYVEEIIAFVKANPKWQLSLQVHKYLGIR